MVLLELCTTIPLCLVFSNDVVCILDPFWPSKLVSCFLRMVGREAGVQRKCKL
jgi:hypothetical protein